VAGLGSRFPARPQMRVRMGTRTGKTWRPHLRIGIGGTRIGVTAIPCCAALAVGVEDFLVAYGVAVALP